MNAPKVGFIGFGEAASLISSGLKSEGVEEIFAFDVNTINPRFGEGIQKRSRELGVSLISSLSELVDQCDIIFNATSAKAAEPIANEVKKWLKTEKLYIDINAASPMTKENVAELIEECGAKFVDAAVMESVSLKKHKVPIYISGSGIKEFQQSGEAYGMELTVIGEKAGSSSAIKMFRSVFMKGFTMLLLETLQSSSKYGVTEIIMKSLEETITNRNLEDIANTLINRTVIHAERRVAEMDEVIKTLKNIDVEPIISTAVKEKLTQLLQHKLPEKFNHQVPEHYIEVIKEI